MPTDKVPQELEEGRVLAPAEMLPCPSQKYFRLIIRRYRWGLTWQGWVAVLGLFVCLCVGAVFYIYPFLAITDRAMPSEILVVEGWTDVPVLKAAYAEFTGGGYKKLITSGSRVYDEWTSGDRITYADWGADRLRKLGVPDSVLQAVPCDVEKKDRTYSSALAVKRWMDAQGIHPRQFNLLTEGAHARRSRLLYEDAFGPDVKIGIIAIENQKFDSARWWRTSEGVREVVGEGIAYLYSKYLFRAGN